jgi:hypothetical protein
MSDSTTSQTQQTSDAWTKMMEEGAARFTSAFAEAARLEAAHAAQMSAAIDHIAKLQKDTLSYAMELSTAWRNQSLEAMQRASSFGKVTG